MRTLQQIADQLALAVRPIAPGSKLLEVDVALINTLAEAMHRRETEAQQAAPVATVCITVPTIRTLAEIVSHEAIVQESYKDSEGVWTWGVGVTDASGHGVQRYKDNPQPISRCLEVYFWLLTNKYLPDVLEAFDGYPLTEAQLTAALSFHYNTGRIKRTDWVGMVKAGKLSDARHFLETHYLNGGDLQERRDKEASLFFGGHWSGDGTALVIPVAKPSYTPSFRNARRVNITADLEAVAAGAGA